MLDWIEPEAWSAFCEMRRKIKAPLTPYAEKLILRELVRLKSAGQDPQACLDQSIRNGWRDVYPLRDKGLPAAVDNLAKTSDYLREFDQHKAQATKPPVDLKARLRRVA